MNGKKNAIYKRISQCLFVLLALSFIFYKNLNGQVKLETTLLGMVYSRGDAELKAVDLNLKLSFSNKGDVPVLIYKNKFIISHIGVSRLDDGVVEQSSTLTMVSDRTADINKIALKDFVILKKNQIYNTRIKVRLFVPYESNKQIAGSVRLGKHVIMIMVYNWDWEQEESIAKQNELRKYGEILTKLVRSEPMPFEIK